MLRCSPVFLLHGAVRFRAAGGFSARFLNLCESGGFRVWDLRQDEAGVTGYVSPRDYRALRLAARSAGMRLCTTEKHGLPFLLRRYRNRVGLAVGAAICVLLAVFCSGFLWSVDTTGAETIGKAEILAAAGQLGLYPGARKPKARGEALASSLVQQLDDRLSWAAVNIIGTRAMLEVREAEREQPETDPPWGDPCDLVADFSGELLSIEVFSGRKANREGNGVKTGDLLISGVREDSEGKRYLYEARGVVTALHDDVRTLSSPGTGDVRTVRAVRAVPVLHLWHLSLPLWFFPLGKDYTAFSETRSAVLRGVTLPFSLETKTRVYWQTRQTDLTPLLYDSFVCALNDAYLRSRLLSGDVRVETENDVCRVTQRSQLIDFMGVKRPLQTKVD